jgi:PAS domain S-box-containing protein
MLRMIRARPAGLSDVGERRYRRKDRGLVSARVLSQRFDYHGRPAQLSVLRDVTRERALEGDLRRSKDLLATILRSAPETIFTLDRAGRFTYINRTRTGVSPEEYLGRPLAPLFNAEARPVWERKRREVLRTRRTVTFETFFDKAEDPIWFSNRLAPLLEDGKVRSLVCVATDVTARKLLEGELAASERYWRDLLKQSPDFITVIGRDLRIRYMNRLAAGFKMEQVIGSSSLAYLTPEYQPTVRRIYERVFRSGKPESFEMRGMGGHGRLRWYACTVSPLVRDGRVDEIVSVGRDITDDKILRGRFESVFLSSKDAIDYVALDGTIVEVNPAYEKLLGYSREEIVNRVKVTDLTPPEYRELDLEAMSRLVKTGEPVEFEKEYIRKDGSRVPVGLTAFCVRGPSGRVEGFAAVVRDISERRRLEREILEAGAREQSKLGRDLHDSLGQTITGIALLAKGLRSRLARSRGPEAQEAHRLAELSSHAVRQVRGLARGLLPSELQSAGLGEALEELANNAQELFGIRCALDCPKDLRLPDEATAVQLYRIAQEAVHNAAKHARSRTGVRVRVDLRAPRTLRLSISDDGVGIPAAPGRGKGLGLGIMEHRARMLGATLSVRRRRPGGGTAVVCDCPLPALQRKA